MMTVLVVDDEQATLRSLCGRIRSLHIPGVGKVCSADSLSAAVDVIDGMGVDILVTDIVMPNGTGIDLLGEVHRRQLGIPTIVISGYDKYEFVSSSFRTGAMDYLIKPVESAKLREALVNAVEIRNKEIEEQINDRWTELMMRSTFGGYPPDRGAGTSIRQMVSLHEEESPGSRFRVISLVTRGGRYGELRELCGGHAVRAAQQGSIVSLVREGGAWDYFCVFADRSDPSWFTCSLVGQLRGACEEAYLFSSDAFVLDSSPVTAIEQVHVLRNYKCLVGSFSCMSYKEHCGRAWDHEYVDVSTARVRDVLVAGRTADLLRVIESVFSPESWQGRSILALEALYREVEQALLDLGGSAVGDQHDYKRPLETFFSLHDLIRHLKRLASRLPSGAGRGGGEGNIVRRTREYVEKHLGEQITMAAVANECNMSYFHFSKVFKQRTGVTFSEWLAQVRLELARERLEQPGSTVAEVAASLGYDYQKNFSRAFKRRYGIAPAAWRDR